MLKKTGKTIQMLAIIFFTVGAIVSFVLAIVFGRDRNNDMTWVFPVILAGGVISAFVVSILLYGFGTLIDNTERIIDRLDHIEQKRSTDEARSFYRTLGPVSSVTSAAPRDPSSLSAPASTDSAQADDPEGIVPIEEGSMLRCPNCKRIQPASMMRCCVCGVRFIKS